MIKRIVDSVAGWRFAAAPNGQPRANSDDEVRMISMFRGLLSQKTRQMCSQLLAGIMLVGLPSSGRAAPIPLFSLGNSIGGNLGAGDFENEGETSLDLTGTDYSVSAATRPEFGALHARASINYNLLSPGERDLFAATGWVDQLTISSPALNGTTGSLDVSFLLDGSLTESGNGFAGAVVGIAWSNTPIDLNDSLPNVLNLYTSIPSSGQVVDASVPFTFGTPFYLASFLLAGAGTLAECPSCDLLVQGIPRTGAGSGTADFYDTLALTGLHPFVDGNLASDVQFSSGSGTAYSLDGVATPVPEPTTLVLLGGGLLTLCGRRRRQKGLWPRARPTRRASR
jgi:hypothetical protein